MVVYWSFLLSKPSLPIQAGLGTLWGGSLLSITYQIILTHLDSSVDSMLPEGRNEGLVGAKGRFINEHTQLHLKNIALALAKNNTGKTSTPAGLYLNIFCHSTLSISTFQAAALLQGLS